MLIRGQRSARPLLATGFKSAFTLTAATLILLSAIERNEPEPGHPLAHISLAKHAGFNGGVLITPRYCYGIALLGWSFLPIMLLRSCGLSALLAG
jgi:hypothetical protein